VYCRCYFSCTRTTLNGKNDKCIAIETARTVFVLDMNAWATFPFQTTPFMQKRKNVEWIICTDAGKYGDNVWKKKSMYTTSWC